VAEIIYLDNNATTRPLDAVVEAMVPLLREQYANPSSVHRFGQSARHAVEQARERVAGLLGASPREIVFTSGGTESINLAVQGALGAGGGRRKLVTSAVEHSATARLAERLAGEGWTVETVGVDGEGRLDLEELAARLDDDTALVSLIWANNETGVLLDVDRIAGITSDRGVPLHLDAVQAVGKVPIDVASLPVQMLSLSGHKFHGPKGVGALYAQRRARLRPAIVGGRQERDRRGGTENVPGIVGMGVAAEWAGRHLPDLPERVGRLRDRLEAGLRAAVPGARVHGVGAPRIANTTNIGFRGVQAEGLLLLLSEHGVCASAGSACSSGSLEPSQVLTAMNADPLTAHGAVRFSLSAFNTTDEVESVVSLLPALLERLTALTPR